MVVRDAAAYNPEGISFVPSVQLDDGRMVWSVDQKHEILFAEPIERMVASTYHESDVHLRLLRRPETTAARCKVGLATAGALFRLEAGQTRRVTVRVPLDVVEEHKGSASRLILPSTWREALEPACEATIPDQHLQFLYDAAVRTLVLHAPGEVYPGPYTYKRFWFRDAAFMLNTLLSLGFAQRVERALESFPARQTLAGYFPFPRREWDSNGEALWILHRVAQLTGRGADAAWRRSVIRAAKWIQRKRTSKSIEAHHAGLLPAGFSAEHLGNNDYYYWDDY